MAILIIPASAGGSSWTKVVDDTLLSSSLTGWTQRTGVWTADGSGFHTNVATSECFLTLDTLGLLAAPYDLDTFALQVDIKFNASSTTGTYAGIGVGRAAVLAAPDMRYSFKRDGTNVIADPFGGAGSASLVTALGDFGTTNYVTYKIVVQGTKATISLNGATISTFSPTPNPTTQTRLGLWCSPGRCDFKNLKIWLPPQPS